MNAGEFLTMAPLEWYDGRRPVTKTYKRDAVLLRSLVNKGWVTISGEMMEITEEGRQALARHRAGSVIVVNDEGVPSASDPDWKPEPELAELLAVENPEPAQLRRIAELVEFVDGHDEALVWMRRAAVAGDRDAVDLLFMDIEDNQEGSE